MARLLEISVIFLLCVTFALATCPNGCSSRGLCVNGACVCPEGLSGSDCSTTTTTSNPTLYECPTCYQVTVGPALYYSGPSWRIPDAPAAGLNLNGQLLTYQGNGDVERVANGTSILSYSASATDGMDAGTGFDSCGAWPMRVFNTSGLIRLFYHAETDCDYNNNGQTHKSAGYAYSTDGGYTFVKPNYPNNRLIDTSTPHYTGEPTGEGDYGVVLRGDYFYLFFANVEQYYTGVARASKSSGGTPGSWYKYYNGAWTQPGVGGNSSKLSSIAGTQAYLHTLTNSILNVGYSTPYWSEGMSMSASDDAINWQYFSDPIIPGDPTINKDYLDYGSFIGSSGGYDVGGTFQFFYMWIRPGDSWNYRYQIYKNITLTYVGSSSTAPLSRVALTTYASSETGEIWQSTQLALPPYEATGVVAYVMSRPYVNSFPLYDCYNPTSGDHFLGTIDECVATGITAYRVAGYIYKVRTVADSVAVYRCDSGTDKWLALDGSCNGYTTTTVYGYALNGPDISSTLAAQDVLIAAGSSGWKFYNSTTAPASTWASASFVDSTWYTGLAPFATGYATELCKTPFGARNYYFRKTFTIPSGRTLTSLLVSVASDNYAKIYVNNVLVDSDVTTWHEAAYWNRKIFIDTSLITSGTNIIAVMGVNGDAWALFDLRLDATYVPIASSTPATCSNGCGTHGQCSNGVCVCDSGYSGSTCATASCKYTTVSTTVAVSSGTTWRHTQWSYVPSTPSAWFTQAYSDSTWSSDVAPFGYNNALKKTYIPNVRHLFRKSFTITIPSSQVISSATVLIASEDSHHVWVNGVFLGQTILPATSHHAAYWNDAIAIDPSILSGTATNVIAVELPVPANGYVSFFDAQINVTFSTKSCSTATAAPTVAPTATPKAATVAPTATPKPATASPTASPKPATSSPTATPKAATVAPTATPKPATTAPTVAPTATPKPATVAPTATPKPATVAPTTVPSAADITVQLSSSSSEWWLAVAISNDGGDTAKVELQDQNLYKSSWLTASATTWGYWVLSPSGGITVPVTLRITSSSGTQLVLSNVITSLSNFLVIQTSSSYTRIPSTAAVTPTPVAPTQAAATKAPTAAATTAPTAKPATVAPTQAAATKAPTAAPTVAPSAKPSSPTATPTPKPAATVAPTKAPTTAPSAQTVKLTPYSGSSAWWLALTVSGNSADITSVQLMDSGSYTSWQSAPASGWGPYVFQPSNALTLPISVRISSASKTITATLTSFDSNVVVDTKSTL